MNKNKTAAAEKIQPELVRGLLHSYYKRCRLRQVITLQLQKRNEVNDTPSFALTCHVHTSDLVCWPVRGQRQLV